MHPSPEFPNIGEHRNQDSLFRLRDVSRALVQNFMELHEYPMFQLGLLCRSSRVLIRAMVWFVQPYFLISKSVITGYQMSKFIQMPYNYIYIYINLLLYTHEWPIVEYLKWSQESIQHRQDACESSRFLGFARRGARCFSRYCSNPYILLVKSTCFIS